MGSIKELHSPRDLEISLVQGKTGVLIMCHPKDRGTEYVMDQIERYRARGFSVSVITQDKDARRRAR